MLMAVSYTALSVSYFGIVGFETANQIKEDADADVPWLLVIIPAVALVAFLGVRSVRAPSSARACWASSLLRICFST
ncbi:hypothetical protein [Cryptosporangium sp. NPDC048952]|uniref:hypothetical protein n=1 Tax=Cryptosporangium sp. NPDC048952 TaxID=3363961 RepID=UPI00371BE6D8